MFCARDQKVNDEGVDRESGKSQQWVEDAFFHLFGLLDGLLLCLGHSNQFGRQAYTKVVWGYFVFSRSFKL